MNIPMTHNVASKPRRRFRIGLRGLIGLVLLLGLVFGLIAREGRRVGTQSAVVAAMRRMGINDAGHEPTYLCFAAMKFFSTSNRDIEARFSKWLDPAWFYRVQMFKVFKKRGRMSDAEVPAAVEQMSRLGVVKEVQYHDPSLQGLRLFYIDRIRYEELGPLRDTCTFRNHMPGGEVTAR